MNNDNTLWISDNKIIEEVKDLKKSIEAFLHRFDQLTEKYGFQKSFKALRRQYLDICCNGDVFINELIKGLVSNQDNYYVNFLEENKLHAKEIKRLIDDYVMETLEELDENNLELEIFY